MTKKKQLPFDEIAMKKSRTLNKNICGKSGSIGLHMGTSCSKKEWKL
jgi:hypothetical protein